ncbi:MAG TPA: hypothetical protein V6C97_15355 [Oculatellaceae cyanobacterium]
MMDRISRSNDRVSEEFTFNRVETSHDAYSQNGQDIWRQGQARLDNTASSYLPMCELISNQDQAANGQAGCDASAGNNMLGGLPNPQQLLGDIMGGANSNGGSGDGSPLSGITNLFSGIGGGSSSGPGSDSTGNTVKTAEEVATVAALFA